MKEYKVISLPDLDGGPQVSQSDHHARAEATINAAAAQGWVYTDWVSMTTILMEREVPSEPISTIEDTLRDAGAQ